MVIHLDNNINKSYILKIPVARYLCRENKKRKHGHKTFSLLPDTLIPYYSITIDTLIYIIELLLFNNYSSHEVLDKIDTVSPVDIIFSEEFLNRCYYLFSQSRLKLILFFKGSLFNHRAPPGIESYTANEMVKFITDFTSINQSIILSNACNLSHLYYTRNGLYIKNSHFLFGTASQFR